MVTGSLFSRDGVGVPERLIMPADASVAASDSVGGEVVADSIPGLSVDSLRVDSLRGKDAFSSVEPGDAAGRGDSVPRRPSRIRREKVDLDHQVVFESKDSMIMVGRNMTYMYGEGQIDYGDLKLNAAEIRLDMDKSEVYACGREDSVGEMQGVPVFEEGGTSYESSTMRYNFRSKRGYITNVITQQGEGFLTGGQTKKTEGEDYYIQNGRYTTCDHHDDPHFWLQLTKAKVRPKKNIVTGPAYMVLAGLPLPLAVPFGYFPFSDKYASGVIVPTFGDDYNRGFYLSDGGYYFAINDMIDLALTGEIYTKGSWGLSAQSTYRKRYKFSGNFNINYLKTIYGEKSDPDYSSATNFQVIWSHSQDSKANPNMNLSASVNFTTSGYTRNSVNSYYSNAFTENTKSSTINMSYRFPNSKWSLSTSLNVSQRTQDSTLAVSFPNINVTMSQVYPFKRKHAVGADRWYEKIRMSYSGQFQNSLTAKQDEFFKKSLIKDWRNGMKHSIPISATFPLFTYFNITPSISLTDRMYTQKVRRAWDPAASAEVADTTYSFYNVWDFNASVSLDTKVYGFFQPLPFLGDKVKMIRHVFTPTVSFSGAPDFSSPFFGYYGSYDYTDAQGRQQTKKYSMFPSALYGVPGQGKTGMVSVSLANNVEMKVKSDNDSIGEKKISLIENFTVSQSYNFAADSLNWSNINTSLLLRLSRQFNLNLSATWDVYTYQLNSAGNPVRVNIPRWKAGKGLGRLSSTGTSFSYTFNNDTFKRKKDGSKNNDNNNNNSNYGDDDNWGDDDTDGNGQQGGRSGHDHDDDLQLTPEGYVPWEVPWSLSVNYSINYSYGNFNKQKMEYDGKITQNLSLSGNIRPTKNWEFSASASYNFDTKKIAYMNLNIARDLHCFTMRASVIPVGPYKSYNFHISVKSSLLSDLKYDKRSSQSNGVKWY
ncbi:MAG: LPS-assembly protein LptD [Muribaculaceae bacterium]|nr:LPS-assembly protein LptD [Muribaculaceae bacterium]